jgi:tRNA (cmo5U34)-methyltransferase
VVVSAQSTPGSHWQREELVAGFAEQRRALIPLLDVQEDVLRRLLQRHEHPIARFLDIGAGAGAVSELVLVALPDSSGVLIDFSPPMLARAGANLAPFSGRWQAFSGDLNDPAWVDVLPAGGYDAVVSGLAIHHLPPERKRALFAEILDLLHPGGIFVNMDYVTVEGPLRGLFDEQWHAAMAPAQDAGTGTHAGHDLGAEDDHDLPDSVEAQMRWLREAGFEQVEVHFKWAEAAVFGGVRPLQ